RYSPAPSKYSYQWQRWDGAWVPIPGATKSSYKLSTGDLLRDLTVKVTAKRSGYTDNVTDADVVGPIHDRMTGVSTPKISGTARVGQTLTVNPGTVTG